MDRFAEMLHVPATLGYIFAARSGSSSVSGGTCPEIRFYEPRMRIDTGHKASSAAPSPRRRIKFVPNLSFMRLRRKPNQNKHRLVSFFSLLSSRCYYLLVRPVGLVFPSVSCQINHVSCDIAQSYNRTQREINHLRAETQYAITLRAIC